MINRIKVMLLSMSAVIMFALTAALPATVLAADCTNGSTVSPSQTNACLCSGSNINLQGTNTDCGGNDTLGKLIRTIINVLSVIIGAIAVVMIIIGGFRYITSAGNPEQTKGARNTILYAIIGLIIVALAQIIVHFVINNTTQATTGA